MLLRAIVLRSSTVADGDNSLCCVGAGAEGVRRCFIRYDADRGSAGLVDDVGDMGPPPFCGWLIEGLRLWLGEEGADEAGDLWEGGV
jgi:hypothetical protein